MTPLLLNGGTRALARLVYVDADGRNVYADAGPDLLVEGIDCERLPDLEPTLADPFVPGLHDVLHRGTTPEKE